jgi:hypothetical protein
MRTTNGPAMADRRVIESASWCAQGRVALSTTGPR